MESGAKVKQFGRTILSLLFLAGLGSLQVQAGHLIGGLMSYRILGFTGNDPASQSLRYRFTLQVYRDCQGSGDALDSDPAGTLAATISIYRLDNRIIPVKNLILSQPTKRSINPNPGNDCLKIPPNVCVEEGIYEIEQDLPVIDTGYVVSYQRCCRNASITNLLEPARTGATFSVEIGSDAQKARLNSPEFRQLPPAVLCVGQPFAFDLSILTDAGDSVVYALASPFAGGGPDDRNFRSASGIAPDPDLPPPYSEVQYLAPGFTSGQPLGAGSTLAIDSRTGIMSGKAALMGQFVLGISVRRFRNGKLLHTLRRDFQVNTGTCDARVKASLPQALPPASGSAEYTIRNCGDTRVTFLNRSQDSLAISSYSWRFTSQGSGEIFTASGRQPQIDFLKPGTYLGKMVLNPEGNCRDSLALRVEIPPILTAGFTVSGDSCASDPLNFRFTGSGEPTTYSWKFGTQGSSSNRDPNFSFTTAGNQPVSLLVTGVGNCRDSLTQQIAYFPIPANLSLSVTPAAACLGTPLRFGVDPSVSLSGLALRWDFGEGTTSTLLPANHTYSREGTFKVSLTLDGGNGKCVRRLSLTPDLTVRSGPRADFTVTPNTDLKLRQTVILESAAPDTLRLLWRTDRKILDSIRRVPFSLPDTGNLAIYLRVTDPLTGCSDEQTKNLFVNPVIRIYIPGGFSPNEDGVNDEFFALGDVDILKDFRLQVFTRWGNLVFISTEPLTGWDGRHVRTGELLPAGTYLYSLSYTDGKGEKQYLSGTVQIIR